MEERDRAEHLFEQELCQGITAVNAFFVVKESGLLATLPQHEVSSPSPQAATFFQLVSQLHAFVVLNYLAVLKIVKKHDKYSERPQRAHVIQHVFSQAFYLSLEHSYLYSACKASAHTSRTSQTQQRPEVPPPPNSATECPPKYLP